eukprot:2388538-Prymnesium_polylepis.1
MASSVGASCGGVCRLRSAGGDARKGARRTRRRAPLISWRCMGPVAACMIRLDAGGGGTGRHTLFQLFVVGWCGCRAEVAMRVEEGPLISATTAAVHTIGLWVWPCVLARGRRHGADDSGRLDLMGLVSTVPTVS